MRKIVLFMHTSLDGFVAGPGGEMDWINVDDPIFEHANRQTELADTALYGRITFEMMESYWPTAGAPPNASEHDVDHSRWYNGVEKVVVSRALQLPPTPKTRVVGNNLAAEIAALKGETGKNILMFGSPTTAHALMSHDLIDEYLMFVNPVVLGSGIPLFAEISTRRNLTLSASYVFPSGVVGSHYVRS